MRHWRRGRITLTSSATPVPSPPKSKFLSVVKRSMTVKYLHMLVLLQFCALTGLGQSTRAIDLVGDTPEDVFLRLIRDGDAERIQTMLLTTSLPLGLDGEYPYECIRTALLFEHGPIAVELINSIIAHNPEMSQGTHFDSDQGTTLLKTSLATGQSEAFKKLWEEGARTTVNSAAYFRELFLTDDVEFMIVLENLGFSPMEWQEGHGSRRYPITFWAAQYGARQIVNRMLELGADPSETTNSGLSLFFVAILSGSSELVADLSRRGADVNAKWMSFSPLSLAALMGNAKIVDVLLGAGAGYEKGSFRGYKKGSFRRYRYLIFPRNEGFEGAYRYF